MVKALEGLPGVTKVELDAEHALFRITMNRPSGSEDLVAAVAQLGYKATRGRAEDFRKVADFPPVSGGPKPPIIREAFDVSHFESKPLLIVTLAAWCPDCRKLMETTFTDPAVKAHLASTFNVVKIDADRDVEAAQWLAGPIIPDICVFRMDGKLADRIMGFIGPDDLARRLALHGGRK